MLLRSSSSRAAGSLENPRVPLTSTSLLDWLGGPKSVSGVRVTEKTALGMPAVYRVVTLLAGTTASLPLHAYRSRSGVREPAGDRSEAEQLLADPHPDLTMFDLVEIWVGHMALWGNSYSRILRSPDGRIRELWPLDPSKVKAGRAKDGTKVYEVSGDVDRTDGLPVPHTDRTIFHIPLFGYDGVCGVSPIRLARQGIGLGMAAEEFGARLFGSGSLASGILQTEQRLTTEAADALKERWRAKTQGLDHAHEAVVLDRGATFQQLTINPDDAQFIESRRFQVEEVARMYGVPPHMVGAVEKSTSWGTGIEQQTLGFVKYGFSHWTSRIEARISKHLFGPSTVYARFNLEGLLRGDSQARASFYRKMWEIGALSTNEIRALEEQPPVEGGNMRYRPLNMGELGTADEAYQQDGGDSEEEEQPAETEEPATEPEPEGADA